MTVPVATKDAKRPSAWSFLLQHVAALFKGTHFTSNRPNGISGPDYLCNGDFTLSIRRIGKKMLFPLRRRAWSCRHQITQSPVM
jgi:hypothetical protein